LRELERAIFHLFGPNVAQAGDEFRGPGLRCVLRFRAGWSGPYFVSLGQNLVRILKFFCFFFFWENRMIKKMAQN
jgi:hypothetical protein